MATSIVRFPTGQFLCFSGYPNDLTSQVYALIQQKQDVTGFDESSFYLICNGRRVDGTENVIPGATYHVVPRLVGGKGGFGSMLRAIGAQIEKTTSREACRDLSGRRMRDVNNEKKLRDWVAKKAEREHEREEKRRERMERRRREPQHKFDDPQYFEQRQSVLDNLENALEQGLKNAGVTSEARKRKSDDPGPSTSKKSRDDWFGDDSDDMGSDSSDIDDMMSKSGPSDTAASASTSGCTSPGPSGPKALALASMGSGQDDSGENAASSADKSPKLSAPVENDEQSDTVSTENGSSTDSKEVVNVEVAHTDKTDPIQTEKAEPVDNSQEELKEPIEIDLDQCNGAEELEHLGLEALKVALMARGLKCGGALKERAQRLYSVKGLTKDQIPPSLFAKGSKMKGKK